MTNEIKKTDVRRKELDRLAELFFPNLSSAELVRIALAYERKLT